VPDLPSPNLVSVITPPPTAPAHFKDWQSGPSTKRELVTITVTQQDYADLKAAGGPDPDDIISALGHYVNLMNQTDWRPLRNSFGWSRGPVAHFLIAIPKGLAAQIRDLPGCFDGHTIEAVRVFFARETDTLDSASEENDLAPSRADSVFATFGTLRLLLSRMLSFLLFP